MDSEIKWLSESIYWSLCDIVGSEEVVEFNRFQCQILEIISKCMLEEFSGIDSFFTTILRSFGLSDPIAIEHILKRYRSNFNTMSNVLLSGSRAEGFDFQSSDYDVMTVLKNFVVVNSFQNISQFEIYPIPILKENSRPGFVRLKLPYTETINPVTSVILNALSKRFNEGYYLRSGITKIMTPCSAEGGLPLVPHGPCISTPDETIDVAVAVKSNTWPPEALGCLHRLLRSGWPSIDVMREMVKDCCLFVSIGCKTSSDEDIEWRMSFSLAEKRLILSMNHTQFLTYAFLKLFLKEVLEKDTSVKGLLCSYFMKTLVFWEIIDTNIPWSKPFLLQHFWNCFRRLLCWVKNEYCPNFFVPENNMFEGKIQGNNAKILQNILCKLYREGYFMPLKIHSIRLEVVKWVHIPQQSTDAGLKRSRVIEKLLALIVSPYTSNVPREYLEGSNSDILLEFSHYLRLLEINKLCTDRLCTLSSGTNRTKYKDEKALFRLLKASSADHIGSKILLVAHIYARKRYESCIGVLHELIDKMDNIRTVHTWNFDVNKYSSLGGDLISVSSGLYKHTTSLVPLDLVSCIPEISEECNISIYGFTCQPHRVAPLVLTYVLLFLCNFWLGHKRLAIKYLQDLRHCIQYGGHYEIPIVTLPMSWTILGRCQEIFGDFRNALKSIRNCEKSASRDMIRLQFESLLQMNERRKRRISNFF